MDGLGSDWIELKKDPASGIESLRAHFNGHAYDPHWHDAYLLGATENGVQQFHCRRATHRSLQGGSFLIEPGEIHDGEATAHGGFTYCMLYVPADWLHGHLESLFSDFPDTGELHFERTLSRDRGLTAAIVSAFWALHGDEPAIIREGCLDAMLERLTRHATWRRKQSGDPRAPLAARRARDILSARMEDTVTLNDVATHLGIDRFRLTRAFKAAYGLSPHAYLVQMRLNEARKRLGRGASPADVASALGFADQSHLGRWFRRAYGLTPGYYRTRCTNVLEPAA